MADKNLSSEEVSPTGTEDRKKRPFLLDLVIRLIKEKPMGTVAGVIVLILLFIAIFADVLAPYGFNEFDLDARLIGPSAKHLIGTDNLGRDLLSRIIYGARISVFIGLGAATLNVIVATTLGITSGFLGGKTDLIIQRFVDAVICFPSLFLYLYVMALVGVGVVPLILVLGINRGIKSSRVVRSAVIGIKENVYVEAARAAGASNRFIATRHILPNVMAPIIIVFSISIGGMILAESSLSFLGFGIPPPTPSWGGMLSQSRRYMEAAPWLALWPGLSLALVIYSLNMLGDAVRDLLDPRLRGGLGRYGGGKKKEMPKLHI